MTTKKTEPTKQGTPKARRVLKRHRNNVHEKRMWEAFALAATANLAGGYGESTEDLIVFAEAVGRHADAMLVEWRKRWSPP